MVSVDVVMDIYFTYAQALGHTDIDGKAIPGWNDLLPCEQKAWRAAVDEAVQMCQTYEND